MTRHSSPGSGFLVFKPDRKDLMYALIVRAVVNGPQRAAELRGVPGGVMSPERGLVLPCLYNHKTVLSMNLLQDVSPRISFFRRTGFAVALHQFDGGINGTGLHIEISDNMTICERHLMPEHKRPQLCRKMVG